MALGMYIREKSLSVELQRVLLLILNKWIMQCKKIYGAAL